MRQMVDWSLFLSISLRSRPLVDRSAFKALASLDAIGGLVFSFEYLALLNAID